MFALGGSSKWARPNRNANDTLDLEGVAAAASHFPLGAKTALVERAAIEAESTERAPARPSKSAVVLRRRWSISRLASQLEINPPLRGDGLAGWLELPALHAAYRFAIKHSGRFSIQYADIVDAPIRANSEADQYPALKPLLQRARRVAWSGL